MKLGCYFVDTMYLTVLWETSLKNTRGKLRSPQWNLK